MELSISALKELSQQRFTVRASGKAHRRRQQVRSNSDSAFGLRGAVRKAHAARPHDPRRRHNEERREQGMIRAFEMAFGAIPQSPVVKITAT